jgi:hypothetical protein
MFAEALLLLREVRSRAYLHNVQETSTDTAFLFSLKVWRCGKNWVVDQKSRLCAAARAQLGEGSGGLDCGAGADAGPGDWLCLRGRCVAHMWSSLPVVNLRKRLMSLTLIVGATVRRS